MRRVQVVSEEIQPCLDRGLQALRLHEALNPLTALCVFRVIHLKVVAGARHVAIMHHKEELPQEF